MKNAVVISIQPKWVSMILDGRKTVEVRKSYPKSPDLPYPFKCYIYCTKEKERLLDIFRDGDEVYGEIYHGKTMFITTPKDEYVDVWEQGRVIGEFDCTTIEGLFGWNYQDTVKEYYQPILGCSCLTDKEIADYGNGKPVYGWLIKNLVHYPTPRKIEEFGLSRPPQSWAYVEKIDFLKERSDRP